MWNGRGVLYVSWVGLNVGSVCWPGYSFGDRFLACHIARERDFASVRASVAAPK
jgi:hypothetical protein